MPRPRPAAGAGPSPPTSTRSRAPCGRSRTTSSAAACAARVPQRNSSDSGICSPNRSSSRPTNPPIGSVSSTVEPNFCAGVSSVTVLPSTMSIRSERGLGIDARSRFGRSTSSTADVVCRSFWPSASTRSPVTLADTRSRSTTCRYAPMSFRTWIDARSTALRRNATACAGLTESSGRVPPSPTREARRNQASAGQAYPVRPGAGSYFGLILEILFPCRPSPAIRPFWPKTKA
jgi:hypothetical protein